MDKAYITNSIFNLNKFANEHGLFVRFRNQTLDCGDFTIFIYRKADKSKVRKINEFNHYLVGFDGYWNLDTKSNLSFDNCWEAAADYIRNYNK